MGWLAGTFWPNSGDEHSYTFIADTFLAGRFSNPPPPDLELFRLFHVFTIEGKTFGQFPPGWPLALAPFRAAGLDWLANPALTVLMGVSLLGAMRRLHIQPKVQGLALVLVLAAPFVLFNGGSMFSHTLCGAAACGIAWQQLADEQRPSVWRKGLTGALFGVLLLTRYEAFAILACLYAADRLWYRRGGVFIDAVPMVLGILPFCVFHLAYDRAITGDRAPNAGRIDQSGCDLPRGIRKSVGNGRAGGGAHDILDCRLRSLWRLHSCGTAEPGNRSEVQEPQHCAFSIWPCPRRFFSSSIFLTMAATSTVRATGFSPGRLLP